MASSSNRITIVLVVALAASLAANAYLALGRRGGASAAAPASSSGGAPAGGASPTSSASRPESGGVAAPAPVRTGTDPATGFAATCPGELAQLEVELAEAERKVEARLSLQEKYELAGHAPDVEQRLRPFLDKVFAGAPDALGRDLECRGSVCKLEIIEPEDGVDFDWQKRMQSDEERSKLFNAMAFYSGTPGQDPVAKDALMTRNVYLGLTDADAISGLDVLAALVARVTESSQLAACKSAHPAPGHLSVRLDLESDTRTIAVAAGGTLAAEAGGACMLGVLQQLVDETEPKILPGTLDASRFFTISVP